MSIRSEMDLLQQLKPTINKIAANQQEQHACPFFKPDHPATRFGDAGNEARKDTQKHK